jgi:leucyl-tRNA synthetase
MKSSKKTSKAEKTKAAMPVTKFSQSQIPVQYDHLKIEKKWQKVWDKTKLYKTKDGGSKPKAYVLDMFPYPSGTGLHVGHPRGYIATDSYSRFKAMNGFNVLHPMGWDAFGLPAEEFALKNKVHPSVAVKSNVKRFKEQLSILGLNYDWSREINTTDPEYYKWTQWAFLQMHKKGLTFESHEPINWCPSCKTGLANEDLEDGKCERCGSVVQQKPIRQWVIKITQYADRLLKDIDGLNWPESIKESQRNWIGRSEGVNIVNKVKDMDLTYEVYDSIPQTAYAQTFGIIAPEHPLVKTLVEGTEKEKEVLEFIKIIKEKKSKNKFNVETDIEGIFTGRYIENYLNTGRDLPIWVASYALYSYGTGAVNCSAHDERDFAFAKKYNIPLKGVLVPKDATAEEKKEIVSGQKFYREPNGVLLEPSVFAGRAWHEVREDMINWLVLGQENYVRGFIDPESPFKADFPIVERDTVHVILKDTKRNKILCLDWRPTFNNHFFVVGGVEKGEDIVEAAKRELLEETGYKNVKFIQKLGKSKGTFFAAHKNENRVANADIMLFELIDDSRESVSAEETAKHKAVWIDEKEVKNLIHPGHQYHFELYQDYYKNKPSTLGGFAKRKVNYKLRDWVFSRQRYWGEPIPLIHCPKCGVVPVPEKELPLKLPNVKSYEPTGTGESPLAAIDKWVNVKCPVCKTPAKRETNTMPQWAGSCWYYLRFIDPKNKKALVDPKKEKYWQPVDMYVGGAEHATRHLIYARFWHKFLFDLGIVSTSEPFTSLKNQGLIAGPDGRKMSKRYGNVVNPDDIVKLYGADTLRVYEMFMGPFEAGIAWSTDNMIGSRRFIERVWRLFQKIDLKNEENNIKVNSDLESLVHRTIKKVGEDIESFAHNTAISALMILLNAFEKETQVDNKLGREQYEVLLKLLAPFAPYMTADLWAQLGNKKSIHLESWPAYDSVKLQSSTMKIVVQINSKVRAMMTVSEDTETSVVELALKLDEIVKRLGNTKPEKVIYVKGKLVNFVVPGI